MMIISPPPPFLISREASEKTPHISENWFKNTPHFSGFSQENLPETNAKNTPFSRENRNSSNPGMHTHCISVKCATKNCKKKGGVGGGGTYLSLGL